MISTTTANSILDWLFGKTSLEKKTSLHIGLCANKIPDDGSLTSAGEPYKVNEETTTYKRVEVVSSSLTSNFNSASEATISNAKEIKFDTAKEAWGSMKYWFLTSSLTGGSAILWGTVKDVLQDKLELVGADFAQFRDGGQPKTFTDKNIITFEANKKYIISIKENDVTYDDEYCTANIANNIVTFTTKTGYTITYKIQQKENSTAQEGIFTVLYNGTYKDSAVINIYAEGINVEKNTVPTFFAGELSASIDAKTT